MKRTLIAPDDTAVRVSGRSFLMSDYVDEDCNPAFKTQAMSRKAMEASIAQHEQTAEYVQNHPEALDIFTSGHC